MDLSSHEIYARVGMVPGSGDGMSDSPRNQWGEGLLIIVTNLIFGVFDGFYH